MTGADRVIEHATCLGCGCACDDITVVVNDNHIIEARNACGLGVAWFGDGTVPGGTRSGRREVSLDRALADAAKLLARAERALVYVAAELSCEAQRHAAAIADVLGAFLDSPTSEIAPSILAAQRRGRAGATLGEIRQRADLLVFWGVDPAERYPRYASRYAVEPAGFQVPKGRKGRTVVAVEVGASRGPADADARVAIAAHAEVDALAVMRATVLGHPVAEAEPLRPVADLARQMMQARYVVVVHDAEPWGGGGSPDPTRVEALIALAQALNGPTRCALSTLRAGGNRSGADAVLTWQTGFPCAVDFGPGYPCYRPHEGAALRLARGEIGAALVAGSPASIPERVAAALVKVPSVAIGPRASAATFGPAVAIDTGVAGIQEGGMAFRMDDVPLPLRPSTEGPAEAVAVLRALADRLRRA